MFERAESAPGGMTRRALLQAGLAGAVSVGFLKTSAEAGEAMTAEQKVPGPVTTVREHLGKPAFYRDGQPYTRPVFETYVPELRYFQQFAEAGCEVHSFSVSFGGYGYTKPMWIGPRQWNFAELDERARRVLEADPKALLMPRIYLGTPEWWLKANPQEVMRLYDGSTTFPKTLQTPVPKEQQFPSIASRKWRHEAAEGLRRLIAHIQQSDYAEHLFGYMVTGLFTEEWYHWSSGCELLSDYNPLMADAFRVWLRRKYRTTERLRAAWSDPNIDYTTVVVPSREQRFGDRTKTFRDPAREMPVIDFYRFYNEIVPETIDHFLKTAKEASGGKKAVGTFYGYMFEFNGDPEFGHNALGRLLESPHLDFMMVTASYFDRGLGVGADYMRSPMTSVALHNKLWYHDNDTVSFRYYDIRRKHSIPEEEIEVDARRLGATRTPQESIWQYRRGAGFVLGAGVFTSWFDLHGGYFDAPELMAEVKRLNQVFEESKQRDCSSVAQILVVSAESSCDYAGFQSPLLQQTMQPPQPVLTKIGAPIDSILVDDLARLDTTPYKLILFLHCYHLTDAQRNLIRKKALLPGKMAVWCYAPGLFNRNRQQPEAMQALTGLKIVPAADTARIAPRIALRASDHPLARRLTSVCLPVIGPEGKSCQLFSVQDTNVVVLGTLPGSAAVTLAIRPVNGGQALYTITPALPAAFYREAARFAGVHLYNDQDDTLYASRSYLTLAANQAGSRTLRLPQPCNVFDPFTGAQLYEDVSEFTRPFQAGETVIFRLERRGQEVFRDG